MLQCRIGVKYTIIMAIKRSYPSKITSRGSGDVESTRFAFSFLVLVIAFQILLGCHGISSCGGGAGWKQGQPEGRAPGAAPGCGAAACRGLE